MMTDSIEPKNTKTSKVVLQLLVGGLAGAIMGYFTAGYLVSANAAGDEAAVVAVGLAYLAMGLFCGAGLVMPGLGAKLLNVEDRGELEEQRRMLTGSSLCMAAIGAALLLLAAAGAGSGISDAVAYAGLLAAVVLTCIVTWRDWDHYDELMLQLSRDAGNFAFLGVGGVILLWSAAAHLGLANALSPLSLVALVAGGLLLAVFVAAGRRGLLQPR